MDSRIPVQSPVRANSLSILSAHLFKVKGMKSTALLTSLLLVPVLAPAADLIVEEFGTLPNYSTISAAVTAAMPGDRIFVKNKSGDIPYNENVVIDKPIELLSYTPEDQFLVQGTYTISANGANFSPTQNYVRIIGMKNNTGSINATSNNSTGNTIDLEIHSSELTDGSILFTGTNYAASLSGNLLSDGNIFTRFATIVGNEIHGSITINDAPTTSGSDPVYIVGNRIFNNTGQGFLVWNNDEHAFHIANNWFFAEEPDGAIQINLLKSNGEANQIINNTTENTVPTLHAAINISVLIPSGTSLSIQNNVFRDGSTAETPNNEFAIRTNGANAGTSIEISYNVTRDWADGLTNLTPSDATIVGNTTSATIDPDNTTGACADAACIDTGHPGNHHADHDLTRNNPGVEGGSYNFNNFWPILTGGARVHLVKTPRTVVQGSPINAEADAHDR